MKLKAINGSQPAEQYKGWENFLKNHCELREEIDGTKFFGAVNCNYIVFPNGMILQNFGFWGQDTMNQIKEKGWETVYNEVKEL